MVVIQDSKIAVVGLGYVGLPLALAFGARNRTIGFDLKKEFIASYREGRDPNCEVGKEEFDRAHKIEFTTDPQLLREADFIVVAVPTPIDDARQPDLRPLAGASETVGRSMKKGATVIFESTVYPGVTEEFCVPLLEKASGLTWQEDFHVGYSPERINPGDKEHTLTKIVKVVSGDDQHCLEQVARLYEMVVEAGVYRASSIKEAEAAKVIENTQRDLNIALMNELAVIFDRLGIDTTNVLEAASTKWNFLPFKPGLVGGHCIGVDPYYLTHKAESVGYHPEVILAGRRINDSMGKFIAEKTIKLMLGGRPCSGQGVVGVVGLTFKEDCSDLRNSKVIDIIREIESFGFKVLVHDPKVSPAEAKRVFGVDLCNWQDLHDLNALVYAVPHKELQTRSVQDFIKTLAPRGCIIDIKSAMDENELEGSGVKFWRL